MTSDPAPHFVPPELELIFDSVWEVIRPRGTLGFDIEIEVVNDLTDMSLKARVPPGYQGCHLIKLNGYVFEGHITSELIKRVLNEKPEGIVGLSIPGMPRGVPGMEGLKDGPSNSRGCFGSTQVRNDLAQDLNRRGHEDPSYQGLDN